MIDIVLTYFSEHQGILPILIVVSILLLIICIILLNIAERKKGKQQNEFVKNIIIYSYLDSKNRKE